jgi:hypothetical protein
MHTQATPTNKHAKRTLKTGLSAIAGFLDIGIGCLLIADLGYLDSFLWGVAGALGFALLYLAVSVGMASLGADAEEDADGPDLADRMDRLREEIEELPEDDEPEPLLVRMMWQAVAGVAWLVFSLVVIMVGFSRSIITVIVFASLIAHPSTLAVVGTLVTSIALQFALSALIIEPSAKKLGVEL